MNGITITALLAFRNLARNRRRSLLTIAAIAFALVCLLVFDALKNGLHQKMVATATETDTGALQIHAKDYGANYISLSELAQPEKVVAELTALGFGNYARRLQITGIFATGVVAFDQNHLFMNLPALQSFLAAGDMVSEIAVALPQQGLVAKAEQLRQGLGSAYQVETWQEISPDLVQLIKLNDTTMMVLILIVFLIVAMGIANTMATITFERFREFGTIAALGATPANILGLVIAEALALGLTASLIGSLVGGVLCFYLGRHGIDLTAFTSANQYFSNNHILKAVVEWRQVVLTNCFTLLTATLAGILPAWTAARQNPVEALGHQ